MKLSSDGLNQYREIVILETKCAKQCDDDNQVATGDDGVEGEHRSRRAEMMRTRSVAIMEMRRFISACIATTSYYEKRQPAM